MELPHMGTHCAVLTCHQLDFLPFNCDLCHKTFCKDHRSYKEHNCTEAYRKDKIVPTCPLCGQALPVGKGMDADLRVNKHIEMECKSESRHKVKSSALCNVSGCKVKELVPVICEGCHLHFCLHHRFPDLHGCKEAQNKVKESRRLNSPFLHDPTPHPTRPAPEASCRILSTQTESLKPKSKAEEDRLIADAIAASLKEPQRQTTLLKSQPPKNSKERKEQEDLDFAIALSLSEADKGKKQKAIQVK